MQQAWDIADPRPQSLIESLRAFGYSPESAIADLVDNSISAGARSIQLRFEWKGAQSTVTVSDDGCGMSEAVLVSAMTLGSMSPTADRDASDLGRFGLGLKTASFSQAREVTVVSVIRGGHAATRRWDLDTVVESGEWRLLRAGARGVAVVEPPSTGGTTVVWSKMDRLVGAVDASDIHAHKTFLDMISRVQGHLEATFQRFLSGQDRVRISINGCEIEPWDPFMTKHPATQQLDVEEIPYKGYVITVRPYVLPHRSKLSDAEIATGQGTSGWTQQQGFYVFRSDRLLMQGSWLGLGLTKDEHTKLARISVGFPSALDHEWQVDVKKSTARPPALLKDSLRRIARATRTSAEKIYRHKGRITARRNSQPFVFAWNERMGRNGAVRYEVNRNHPIIVAALDAAGSNRHVFDRAIRLIEETVPTSLIGLSIAQSIDNQLVPFDEAQKDLRPLIEQAMGIYTRGGMSRLRALDTIANIEPFANYPALLQALREEES